MHSTLLALVASALAGCASAEGITGAAEGFAKGVTGGGSATAVVSVNSFRISLSSILGIMERSVPSWFTVVASTPLLPSQGHTFLAVMNTDMNMASHSTLPPMLSWCRTWVIALPVLSFSRRLSTSRARKAQLPRLAAPLTVPLPVARPLSTRTTGVPTTSQTRLR